MIDVDLLVEQLRARGHAVTHVNKVPENAGEYEFEVDGAMLSLSETRALLAADQTANA